MSLYGFRGGVDPKLADVVIAATKSTPTVVETGTDDASFVTPAGLSGVLPFRIVNESNTVTDINAVAQELFTVEGGGVIRPHPGIYTIPAPIILPSGVSLIGGPGVIFDVTTPADAIQVVGSIGAAVALTANQTAGAFTIALPAGQGANFAVDDIIVLQSNPAVPVIPGTPGVKPREMFQVLSIATDTLTVDKALMWAYNTADGATFAKVTPVKDVDIDVTLRYASPGNEGRGVALTYASRCSARVRSINGPGVFLSESIMCDIWARVDGDKIYADSRGYASSVAGSGHGNSVNMKARACRHAFTTQPFEAGGQTYSGPFGTEVRGKAWGGTASFAVWDTHLGAVDTTFLGVEGNGPGQAATPVLQDRAYRTKVIGATLRGSTHGVTAVADNSVGLMVLDSDIAILPASGGACCVIAGDDAVIRGNRLLAPSGYGVDNVGDRTLVENNVIQTLSCWRENAGVDTGFIARGNTVKLHTVAGFGGISTARGLQKDNVFIAGTSTAPFLSAPGASARLEVGWQAPTVVTYAASVTPNPGLINNIRITLTGNITIPNPAALQKIAGSIVRVTTVQDATGGRTHTWGTDFKVLTAAVTTANARNRWDFQFDGTNWIETAATVGLV